MREVPTADGHPKRSGTRGAVFVEFLIAFLPVFTFFLCLVQLALLFAVKLLVEHAAVNAARTAAVVIGDDPKFYGGSAEPLHEVKPTSGARYQMIRRAALYTLAPFIVDGTIRTVDIEFPPAQEPDGKAQSSPKWSPMADSTIDKVRVRVLATAACKIGLANQIACGGFKGLSDMLKSAVEGPSIVVRAEAVYPYQGASYTYK